MVILLLSILTLSTTLTRGAFTPTDHYLLSCGTSSAATSAVDGRRWLPDQNSTFAPLPSFSSSSVSASAKHDASVGSVPPGAPFSAARIFNSTFTYTLPVSPGPKFLRLYFLPSLYDASGFYATVYADDVLLLRNFSAQLTLSYYQTLTLTQSLTKEYHLTVPQTRSELKLTISPTPPSSHAFLNGIELVSVPDSLYITPSTIADIDSHSNSYSFPPSTALETAYRLNVGGDPETLDDDTIGMYRIWKDDTPYTINDPGQPGLSNFPIKYTTEVAGYTAPAPVYQTWKQLPFENNTNIDSNLTWRFGVDPGFSYLVRLHWCEMDEHVNAAGDRVFAVYVNGVTAESDMDVFFWAGEKRYVPYYKDYVVYVEDDGRGGGSADVWIALHPNTTSGSGQTRYREVLLNGLEMFKINNVSSDGASLAGPNPQVPLDNAPSEQSPITNTSNRSHTVLLVVVGVVSTLFIASLACAIIICKSKKKTQSSSQETSSTKKSYWLVSSFVSGSKATSSDRNSTLPSHLCRRFSISEIRMATHDFSESLVIGHGGFGNVYRGTVAGEKGVGVLTVAIKRLNATSKQGVHEFTTEIEMLSNHRHAHLVTLIGFCDEGSEMILVYEYMANGTLRDHLYNTRNGSPSLSWPQRLSACLGATKGLHYLHSGASQMIIHRDVKSTNILLDEKWVSKVSDFGLSKFGPTDGELSHVSTVVKGSVGYLDLEYYKTQRLTEKSDVYSLGVVLLEVLCGRPAVDPSMPKEQVNLAKWAIAHIRNGTLEILVDPNIKDAIAPSCLNKFGEIAESCVREHGTDRPSMADLVWSLEFAIQLQQGRNETKPNYCDVGVLALTGIDTSDDGFDRSSMSGERTTGTGSSSGLFMSESVASSVSVFSEIHRPGGR